MKRDLWRVQYIMNIHQPKAENYALNMDLWLVAAHVQNRAQNGRLKFKGSDAWAVVVVLNTVKLVFSKLVTYREVPEYNTC